MLFCMWETCSENFVSALLFAYLEAEHTEAILPHADNNVLQEITQKWGKSQDQIHIKSTKCYTRCQKNRALCQVLAGTAYVNPNKLETRK